MHYLFDPRSVSRRARFINHISFRSEYNEDDNLERLGMGGPYTESIFQAVSPVLTNAITIRIDGDVRSGVLDLLPALPFLRELRL